MTVFMVVEFSNYEWPWFTNNWYNLRWLESPVKYNKKQSWWEKVKGKSIVCLYKTSLNASNTGVDILDTNWLIKKFPWSKIRKRQINIIAMERALQEAFLENVLIV